jgi:glucose-6-phosphate 1-dehydrogenase
MPGRRGSDGRIAIVIFGASGDVTSRKVVPALHSLRCARLLDRKLRVIGFARSDLSDDGFREKLRRGVMDHARIKPSAQHPWGQFANEVHYLRGDYNDPKSYRSLTDMLSEEGPQEKVNCLFYLATPPELFPIIVKRLGASGLSRSKSSWRRIILEKPFGEDVKSARRLNASIHEVFNERQVYRIDHYLGKETVQNILTLRFANTIFEPIWNRNYVDHVQITIAEDVGIENRAGYYEQAGVVRDMVQNHVLQLVSLTAMEPPSAFNEDTIRDEKAKLIDAIRRPRQEDTVYGQYEGYRQEPGVKKDSEVATFVALKLYIDNWRWDGVPFYVRTGKRLKKKETEVILKFKSVPLLLFPEDRDASPNRLSLSIQPDEGLELRLIVKQPGMGMRTSPADMVFHYNRFGEDALPEAYEPLLLDAVHGDATLFAREDEVEKAWSVVEPLLRVGEGQRVDEGKLHTYRRGSWGPAEADRLMKSDGRSWELSDSLGRTMKKVAKR